MLLDLPPELVQLVLKYASTPSYLQAAVSCRTLYEIASTCREVILHHLRRTPGLLTQGIESWKTRDLFLLLRRRAARQLYGANFSADRTLYSFPGRTIDVKASSVAASGDPNVALVVKGDSAVHLFHAGNDGSVSRRASLIPPYEQPGKVEVLRTAFSGDGSISVLQRFIPEVEDEEEDSTEHPFVKQAKQSPPSEEIHLLHYDFRSPSRGVTICTFPDRAEYKPLALAAAGRDRFAISWQHLEDDDQHEVVLYSADPEDYNETTLVSRLRYRSTVVMDDRGQWPGRQDHQRPAQAGALTLADVGDTLLYRTPVTDLAFNDRATQLLYSYRASTLYGVFQNVNAAPGMKPAATRMYVNLCRVRFSESLTLPFSIGIPFFGTHDTYEAAPNFQVCHWRYLAFGTATHREENWTVACLLRSEARCRARNCGHVLNLDRGRRFADWTIVARLWGYKRPSNSLGNLVAASAGGTRIAVANWREVYVWALEPQELIEGNASEFYPACWRSTNPPEGIVELRPIVLRLEAVCFKLCFVGEDQLVALTDRGLMYWDLGPRGTGVRRTDELEVPDEK